MFLFDGFLMVYEMYARVTKHGDRCPSLMGVNWVGDTVGINSVGGMYLPEVFAFKVE